MAVVHCREQVQRKALVCARKLNEPGDCAQDAEQVDRNEEEEGAGDAFVEESAIDDSTFGGDVEAAQLWIEEGKHGGNQDVGRENGLVDLVPVGVAVTALNARVRDAGKHKMRKGVGEDRGPVAGKIDVAEDEIDQWSGEKDQTRQSVEKVRHGVEVADTLREAKAAGEQWVVGAQDLNHTARPANALPDVAAEPLGSKASGLRNVDIGGVPAAHLHAQRGVSVLCDCLDGNATDFVERGTSEDGAGAAEEGGVPEVIAVLNDAVEEIPLIGDHAELVQIALEGIRRIEVMRRLQHSQFVLAKEPAEGDLQETAGGDMVAVEDGDVGGVEMGEGVVDIAGFCVLVGVARHVADACVFGKFAELFAVAVVEEVDVEFGGGPVD